MFADYLNKGLDNLTKAKEEFIQEFSMADYEYIVDGWKEKLVRCSQGHQKWAVLYAEKKNV